MEDDLNIKIGIDKKKLQEDIKDTEKNLEELKEDITLKVATGYLSKLLKRERVIDKIIDEKQFEIESALLGYEKIDLEPKIEIKIEDEKAKETLTDLQKFEIELAKKIDSIDNEISKRRLQRIKKYIELNKISGEHSDIYMLQKAQNDLKIFESYEQSARETRMGKLQEELQNLQREARFGAQTYSKAIEELKIVREKQLKAAEALKQAHPKEYQEEVSLIEENYNAKLAKLKKQEYDEIKRISQETADIEFDASHSAFEKQLRDIEQWKKAQLEKADTIEKTAAITANAAAKEAQAFEREIDRIKDKNKSLAEKIFELTHGKKAIEMKNLQKEAHEYLEAGADPQLVNFYLQGSAQKQGLTGFNTDFWQNINDFANAFTQNQTANLSSQMEDLKSLSVSSLETSFNSAGDAAINLATAFNDSKLKLDSIHDFAQDSPPLNLQTQNLPNYGDISRDLNAITNALSPLAETFREIAELSKTAGSIAADANQKNNSQQLPEIKIDMSNMKIDLGGAYVFDNEMKAQLTDDITTEVVNAVTNAVEQGTNEFNFKWNK